MTVADRRNRRFDRTLVAAQRRAGPRALAIFGGLFRDLHPPLTIRIIVSIICFVFYT